MSIDEWIGLILIGVVFFVVYFVGLGAGLTLTALDREQKWDESKKEAALNILICVGWPLVWVGGALWFLLIEAPKALYNWWNNLPDEKSN